LSKLERPEAEQMNTTHSIGFYSLTMPKRLEHVQRFAARHGFQMNIVPGVIAKNLNETELVESGEIVMNFCPPTMTVALAQGHRNALKEFLKSENDFGIIFEDDVAVGGSQIEHRAYGERPILEIMDELASTHDEVKWDWLNLGRCIDHCAEEKVLIERVEGTKNVKLVESGNPMCAHAYMVTRRGAKMLLKNTWPFYAPWDVMPMLMHKASKKNEFKLFSTTPRLFVQDRNLGPSLHTDSNPECFEKMAHRFIGEQWEQLEKNQVSWASETLLYTGKSLRCPAWVDPDEE